MNDDVACRSDPRRATSVERRILAFLIEHGRWNISRLHEPNAEVVARLVTRGWLRQDADVVTITMQGIGVHVGVRMDPQR